MNSHWLSKSNLNIDAAEKLKNNPNYHHSSSIHCSYYACVQKLTHILHNILGYTEGSFNVEYNTHKARTNMGSHDYLIHLFWNKIGNRDREQAKDFKNQIAELKKLRVDADYKDILLDKTASERAYTLATSVIKNLNKNF